jgi:hypothetical protein
VRCGALSVRVSQCQKIDMGSHCQLYTVEQLVSTEMTFPSSFTTGVRGIVSRQHS